MTSVLAAAPTAALPATAIALARTAPRESPLPLPFVDDVGAALTRELLAGFARWRLPGVGLGVLADRAFWPLAALVRPFAAVALVVFADRDPRPLAFALAAP